MKDFDASKYFTAKKSVRSNDRVTHFAVAATKLAIEDAGIDVKACGDRCGVMVRTCKRERPRERQDKTRKRQTSGVLFRSAARPRRFVVARTLESAVLSI